MYLAKMSILTRNCLNSTIFKKKRIQNAKDGMVRFQNKFLNKNAKVNQNVEVRWTDRLHQSIGRNLFAILATQLINKLTNYEGNSESHCWPII